MMERFDVRLAGLGGQGLLLAGLILGHAVTIYDKRNAVQTVNYAPLARGAPSRAEVVISDGSIYFPEVLNSDVLLAMNQSAYDEFKSQVKPGGIIIADTENVKNFCQSEETYKFPISKIAKLETGRTITGSIVGLGIISIITGIVTPSALTNAVKTRAPRGTVQTNLRALSAGLSAMEK
ncbi:MAG: 2-oxoacid:acceptor oxidoreductase family protein [Candidatus Eremiobacteraeota bacterium]|nr:2-oxoacid:acceptor oxidoreductase family protein [Candidatus Eremiobacteraeota bacterium]